MAANINEEHKDRVFKFLFGNPERLEWTLSLYNAVNGSSYDNPDDISLNTIEDVLYLGMKIDVSFIIMDELHLWEHQSTFNPNMPMRFFIYAAKLYEKYISDPKNKYNRYSTTLQTVHCPKCICFYNGTGKQPEKKILRLSDAFKGRKSDIEVTVTMLNVNYGKNAELMRTCKPMEEYAWLVAAIRRHEKITHDLEQAIDAALAEMPDNFVIKKLLILNKAEVKGMFLTEWDMEKALALNGLENEERGIKIGEKRGEKRTRESVARDMLLENLPLSLIVKISKLSEEVVLKLAKKLGVTAIP